MTTMVLDQAPELLWGSFVLRSDTDPDVPWRCETLATTEFGNAIPIIEFIESSLIVDGGEAVVTGWERRTFTVEIRITAPDGQAMSQAQQALFALVHGDEKPPLLWTPPMVGAWTGAFDVLAVKFLRKWDVPGDWSHRERYLRQRVFQLEFTCKTWIRDPEPIVVPALPVPEDPDEQPADWLIDPCTSANNWWVVGVPGANWPGPTIEIGGPGGGLLVNALYQEAVPNTEPAQLRVTRDGGVNMNGLPLLGIVVRTSRWEGSATVTPDLELMYYRAGGTPTFVRPVAMEAIPGYPYGRYRVWFPAPPAGPAPDMLQFRWFVPLSGLYEGFSMRIFRVFATDRVALTGSSGFQVPRTITIEGSAPTGAAITFDAGDYPLLGSTAMIYTGPSPVVPLRSLGVGVPPGYTADNWRMSGAWNTMAGLTTALVPVERLDESMYDLMALLSFTGLARVSWSARLVAEDGTDIPGSDLVRSGEILLRNDSADPWRIHTLAGIRMPVIRIKGPTTHAVEIKTWMTTGGAAVKVDERWLVDQRGAVTLVHEPSTQQLSGIEIGSPQLGAPRYEITGTWIGHGSQDISRLARIGRHRFPPGPLHIFTASDFAKYAPCSLRYHRTHAQEPGPALPVPPSIES